MYECPGFAISILGFSSRAEQIYFISKEKKIDAKKMITNVQIVQSYKIIKWKK